MSNDIDYGPLTPLIGTWQGDGGMDVAPEDDGPRHSPYYETMVFEAAGDVDNADTQELVIVRYHQVVSRKKNDKVFHNESGYWMWDQAADTIIQTLSIPRGLSLVAGGSYSKLEDGVKFDVSAAKDDADFGIVEAPFLQQHASTNRFVRTLTVRGDQLSYHQTTFLNIYDGPFEHTDENVLKRV